MRGLRSPASDAGGDLSRAADRGRHPCADQVGGKQRQNQAGRSCELEGVPDHILGVVDA